MFDMLNKRASQSALFEVRYARFWHTTFISIQNNLCQPHLHRFPTSSLHLVCIVCMFQKIGICDTDDASKSPATESELKRSPLVPLAEVASPSLAPPPGKGSGRGRPKKQKPEVLRPERWRIISDWDAVVWAAFKQHSKSFRITCIM